MSSEPSHARLHPEERVTRMPNDEDWAIDAKPCVGSGLCCLKARCSIGVMVHGPGAECPSLVWKEGRYWCGEILKAEGEAREDLRRQLSVGAGCCMPLFNSLREERFRSMTEAEREEYRNEKEKLITISSSRSFAASSKK